MVLLLVTVMPGDPVEGLPCFAEAFCFEHELQVADIGGVAQGIERYHLAGKLQKRSFGQPWPRHHLDDDRAMQIAQRGFLCFQPELELSAAEAVEPVQVPCRKAFLEGFECSLVRLSCRKRERRARLEYVNRNKIEVQGDGVAVGQQS